jgi:glycosyltransferase involved in cell wall biosynthesis
MLSIIIPAYNAEKTIGRTLREYVDYFSAEYEGDFEILIVANGCTDRTSDLVLEQCARFPEVRHSSFEGKIGKGGAIIEGFKAVTGDIVGFVGPSDRDGSPRPMSLSNSHYQEE